MKKNVKNELIKDFLEIRQQILCLCDSIPPAKQNEIFLGSWSIKDLLAHLIGWDEWNAKAIKEILGGKLPSFYQYYDEDWTSFNKHLVEKYREENWKKLLRLLGQSQQKLITLLEVISNQECNKDRGLRWQNEKITIAGEFKVEIDDERIHYRQINEWLKRSIL